MITDYGLVGLVGLVGEHQTKEHKHKQFGIAFRINQIA